VWRTCKEDCGIMAIIEGRLVGTMGLIKVPWWYNLSHYFMIDRWFFCLPEVLNKGVGVRLRAEAAVIADAAGLPLFIMGKWKKGAKRPFISPEIYPHEGQIDVLRRLDNVDPNNGSDA
jgi:hypothetical protein